MAGQDATAVSLNPFDAGMQMFGLFEHGLAASLAWWAPVHARSTANARRLGRRR
jgi:hypothetical protein